MSARRANDILRRALKIRHQPIHSLVHSLASWFIATITGWGTGAMASSSILGRLGSGSFSNSKLEGLLTSTGGDVEAWAAKI